MIADDAGTGARPARVLPVIVLSQFAGTSLWFAGNALMPDLQRAIAIPGDAVAAVTSAVQLGFIAGTLLFAILNVADRHSPRAVFLVSSIAAAAANAGLLALPHLDARFPALLALRFATGFFLAGIYPVGMKIAASWYREGLGAALGWLVGALVLGTALPHLVRGAGGGLPWERVVLVLSALAVAGGVLMHALVPDGPALARAPRFDPTAIARAFAVRSFRASSSGYFGHMWELYTLWAFTPVLLAAHGAAHGVAHDVSSWSFAVIGAGALGCVGGGGLSRRFGSARVAFGQLALSGLCCLALPLAFALPGPGFLAFMVLWGVVVVGDSPQFSALNATHAPRAFVGSALTIVNGIGFSVTVASVAVTGWVVARTPVEYAFLPIAIGPALGLAALWTLARPGAAGASASRVGGRGG